MLYITYTVEKKNAVIILSAMEIHYQQKFYHFITMPFSENFAPPSLRAGYATATARYC